MPPPARAPADPHPASADADSAELIPGHIPFPPPDLTEASDGVDARAPPRLYPALPRGLKPFEPPTREERRLCRVQNAVREFCRATSRDRGGEDDARERRVREGDVKRWGDDAGDDAAGGGGEDDATRDDGETSDSSEGATERWIERFRKSRAWETCRVTDESIVPREILECAFPETRAREDEDEDEGWRGKKRAASRSNDVTARSSKRGRATASGSERLEDGGTKTKMKDGFSRLERLVQLESRAEAEGAGRGGRDDDEEGYDDERGQTRSGRASGRRSTRDRSRSLSRNPRRGGANDDGGDDDDKFGDDDDELESDDDYGQGANFDDDEGYDDDVGDGNAEAYF